MGMNTLDTAAFCAMIRKGACCTDNGECAMWRLVLVAMALIGYLYAGLEAALSTIGKLGGF